MKPIALKRRGLGGLFRSGDINMLEGPLFGKVFAFVLPLMITNLLQVCYSAADMIVVGLSGVDGAIGAIGTTTALINLVLNIFTGFGVGTGVVVARNIGRGDREATERSVHTSLLVGVCAGLLCMVIGLAVSRPVLHAMGDQGHILDLATLYTQIYFLGVPFMAAANFMIAILRAKGDTRTPLYILTFTGLLNVGLNLLFVLAFDMSVDGVAAATSISNAASAVLLAIRLTNEQSWCRLSFKRLRFHREELRDILRDGLPAAVQGALFSLSNMLIQSSIIGLNNATCPGGSDIIDGNAAGSSIENFIYTATNAVCQAAVTFTSQHYGARKFRRIGLVMRTCYLVTGIISVVGAALIIALRYPLIGLYVSSDMAVEAALARTYTLIGPYFTLAFMEVGSGVLRGLARSMLSTTVTLVGCCLLRVVWVWTVFRIWPSLEIIYLSYPISWTVTAVAHFLCSMHVRRKCILRQEAEDAAHAAAAVQ